MNDLTLRGDLCQIMAQAQILSWEGFALESSDVYRIVPAEAVEQALLLIWQRKIEGWWHYECLYVEHGICTSEEYRTALRNA